MKTNTNNRNDELVIKLVEDQLLRYTIQFFNKGDDGLKPFGSGILAKIHGCHFILTASHVADFLIQDGNQLYIRVDKKGYINVLGDIKYTDIDKSKGIDLAYIKLDQQMIPQLIKPYKFLPIDKIRKHTIINDSMNYCVVGFPEKNVRRKDNSLETGATFFLTSAAKDNTYNYYKLNKNDHYTLLMEGKGVDIVSGDKTKVDTHFYGISGCGLWYLIFKQNTMTGIFTVDYRLIGIMTEFKKGKYFCLIANKINLIMEAFQVIEGFKFNEISVD